MKKIKSQKITASSLFGGAMILDKNGYSLVDKVEINAGQGVVTVWLCNIESGFAETINFSAKEKVSTVLYKEKEVEYWHKSEDSEEELFFDINALNAIKISPKICESKMGFIKKGIVYKIIVINDETIGIVLPRFIEIEVKSVIQDEDIVVDNKDSQIKVELETGMVIEVPNFIERSDILKVDTRKRKFVQRF